MYKRFNQELIKFVNESAAAYSNKKDIDLQELLADRFLIAELIELGVPYALFYQIKEMFPFNLNDWASYLDISLKSLQRYHNEARRFKPIHSEKIIELLEVFVFGVEVFENDADQFKLWLKTPVMALAGKRPIDLLKNSYGQALVMDTLAALEYGIFA